MEIALPPRRRRWIAKQPVEAARDTGGQYHHPPSLLRKRSPGEGEKIGLKNSAEELAGGEDREGRRRRRKRRRKRRKRSRRGTGKTSSRVLGAFMGRKGM
jgi:hypothetical protein